MGLESPPTCENNKQQEPAPPPPLWGRSQASGEADRQADLEDTCSGVLQVYREDRRRLEDKHSRLWRLWSSGGGRKRVSGALPLLLLYSGCSGAAPPPRCCCSLQRRTSGLEEELQDRGAGTGTARLGEANEGRPVR